jgi:hypothetical protein
MPLRRPKKGYQVLVSGDSCNLLGENPAAKRISSRHCEESNFTRKQKMLIEIYSVLYLK